MVATHDRKGLASKLTRTFMPVSIYLEPGAAIRALLPAIRPIIINYIHLLTRIEYARRVLSHKMARDARVELLRLHSAVWLASCEIPNQTLICASSSRCRRDAGPKCDRRAWLQRMQYRIFLE